MILSCSPARVVWQQQAAIDRISTVLNECCEVCTCTPHEGVAAVEPAVATSATSKAKLDAVAKRLVTKMWKLAETNDTAGLEKFINKAFQAQDAEQSRWNKRQFIAVLGKEILSDFALSNLRATQAGDTIVVTYTATASQSVNGVELSGDPKPRMTVFVQSPKTKKYTVMSHSSFNVPTTQS